MAWVGPVLRDVLHDIVAVGRLAGNSPAEAPPNPVEGREKRRVTLDQMRTVARKGVKCRHLGGDKRAPRCLHEDECDEGNSCLLPNFESASLS